MSDLIGTAIYGASEYAGLMTSLTLTATASVATASVSLVASVLNPPGDSITIVRTNILTGTQTPVRGAFSRSITGQSSFTITDYEAPLNVPVQYTATISSIVLGVLTRQYSATSQQVTINAPTNTCWLKNVLVPAQNLSLRLSDVSDLKYSGKRQVSYVIGRANAVVLNDVRAGRSGTLTFSTFAAADRLSFLGLIGTSPGASLFLQVNASDGFEDMYFSAGDVTEKRNGARSYEVTRSYEVAFDEVDYVPDTTPFIGTNTYLNLLYWTTYQDALSERSTYAALLSITAGSALGDTP